MIQVVAGFVDGDALLCQVAEAGACRGQAVRFAASVRGEEAGCVALSVQLMDR